jgi:hypothetical protein
MLLDHKIGKIIYMIGTLNYMKFLRVKQLNKLYENFESETIK